MITLVLPGFNQLNKAWAEEIKYHVDLNQPIEIIEWKHWKTGNAKDFSPLEEANGIAKKYANEEINIVAKSMGTLVTMHLFGMIPLNMSKVILCGIPLHDLKDEDKKLYEALETIPAYKTLVIQNTEDPLGSWQEVTDFLKSMNPLMNVQQRIADTHDYPYWEEFKRILRRTE